MFVSCLWNGQHLYHTSQHRVHRQHATAVNKLPTKTRSSHYRPKPILNWNLAKYRLSVVCFLVYKPYVSANNTAVLKHHNDVIMGAMASQITNLTIIYSTVYSGADERKHQSSASLAFVWGNHRSLVNSPHKEPVTRKMFPFDDVIMISEGFVA